MNFDLSEDQRMTRENFARFLDEQSNMSRVRAAQPGGFDAGLWRGLAELGAFALRVQDIMLFRSSVTSETYNQIGLGMYEFPNFLFAWAL